VGILAALLGPRTWQVPPLVWALAYAGGTLLMALWWDRRGLLDSLLALAPPILGLLLTFGLMPVFGIPLNPANLIILPLILGIGVDNGVHVMHDFHARPDEPYCPSSSLINAVCLTATTTMVGFGSMMIAAHRGLYSLGAVLTIGVGACLFVALIILPAALALVSRQRSAGDEQLSAEEIAPQPASEADAGPQDILPLPSATRVA
jgi:hypothetical protein